MTFFSEIAVTVVGGIITAIIIGLFTRKSKKADAQPERSQQNQTQTQSGSTFGNVIHLLISVILGVLLATTLGRQLFKSGILERGPEMRLLIVVVAIVLIWSLIGLVRKR